MAKLGHWSEDCSEVPKFRRSEPVRALTRIRTSGVFLIDRERLVCDRFAEAHPDPPMSESGRVDENWSAIGAAKRCPQCAAERAPTPPRAGVHRIATGSDMTPPGAAIRWAPPLRHRPRGLRHRTQT